MSDGLLPCLDALRAAGHDPIDDRPARRVTCSRCEIELTDSVHGDACDEQLDLRHVARCPYRAGWQPVPRVESTGDARAIIRTGYVVHDPENTRIILDEPEPSVSVELRIPPSPDGAR